MDTQRTDPQAALPAFLRGIRALHGLTSLRMLARQAEVTVSVLSRVERGLAVPSVDLLYKWSIGIGDGRPKPELWATAVAGAAVTWPDDTQFALVRLFDEPRDPDVGWALAVAAGSLTVEMIGRRDDGPEAVLAAVSALMETGARDYPRFVSAVRSPVTGRDAAVAAWFALMRHADEAVWAEMSRHLLDPEKELGSVDGRERELLFVWLAERFVLHGRAPFRMDVPAATRARDPLRYDLNVVWPHLALEIRTALLTLAQAAASDRDRS